MSGLPEPDTNRIAHAKMIRLGHAVSTEIETSVYCEQLAEELQRTQAKLAQAELERDTLKSKLEAVGPAGVESNGQGGKSYQLEDKPNADGQQGSVADLAEYQKRPASTQA